MKTLSATAFLALCVSQIVAKCIAGGPTQLSCCAIYDCKNVPRDSTEMKKYHLCWMTRRGLMLDGELRKDKLYEWIIDHVVIESVVKSKKAVETCLKAVSQMPPHLIKDEAEVAYVFRDCMRDGLYSGE